MYQQETATTEWKEERPASSETNSLADTFPENEGMASRSIGLINRQIASLPNETDKSLSLLKQRIVETKHSSLLA